ncbi:nicotinate (nicotinamide) nucleotide adenylyltransferase [Salinimonas chungwhensis]|uniref:nicotinate (nicotinamide) nucleotide adenylyltransferase n=1 Tax=Salinimonas chungwhensis TaxID=265425 RepID=UPI0003809855|nr:nicotinate (nicotinamide) nucleotide adenylyltransferase [Salinimonas chungwhensis]
MKPTATCILGGTFNPPHRGHIEAALDVCREIDCEAVGLMPCRLPPHKQIADLSEQHRVRMVELAVENTDNLYPELLELSLDEPSYTVKTLKYLRQRDEHAPLIFVMGEDSWQSLTNWYEWEKLSELAHLVVMRRQTQRKNLAPALVKLKTGHKISDPARLYQQPAGYIYFAETRLQPISSTQLRDALGHSPSDTAWLSDWLQPSVLQYIKENRLYV